MSLVQGLGANAQPLGLALAHPVVVERAQPGELGYVGILAVVWARIRWRLVRRRLGREPLQLVDGTAGIEPIADVTLGGQPGQHQQPQGCGLGHEVAAGFRGVAGSRLVVVRHDDDMAPRQRRMVGVVPVGGAH